MPELSESSDPVEVFGQLAGLLVPAVCDDAVATVLVGEQLAKWLQNPPRCTSDLPTTTSSSTGPKWSVTVYTTSQAPGRDDSSSTDPDYVAALTCGGSGAPPTVGEVALIKLAGHYAGAAVHRARRAELLAQQRSSDALNTSLHTHHVTGAAVGVLMAKRQLPYRQASDLLRRASQDSNRELAAVADTIRYIENLPPGRPAGDPPEDDLR